MPLSHLSVFPNLGEGGGLRELPAVCVGAATRGEGHGPALVLMLLRLGLDGGWEPRMSAAPWGSFSGAKLSFKREL